MFCVIDINCGICGVTEFLSRKSVYRTALLGDENAKGPKDTVELNVEWSRQQTSTW
jgi:hypothetical protein